MQSLTDEKKVISSSYEMFTSSISDELTRKYYERSLKTFFDYMGFYIQSHLEERCNPFAGKGVTDGQTLNGLLFRADED